MIVPLSVQFTSDFLSFLDVTGRKINTPAVKFHVRNEHSCPDSGVLLLFLFHRVLRFRTPSFCVCVCGRGGACVCVCMCV